MQGGGFGGNQGGYGHNPGYGQPGMPGMPGMGYQQPGMGYQQPGMPGMGMNMGYQQEPYGYRDQNWNGYHMNHYNLQENWVNQNWKMIFETYDRNDSGTLDMSEVPAVVNYVFQMTGNPPPNPNDVYYAMYQFDRNRDGRLGKKEFRKMLHYFAGRDC